MEKSTFIELNLDEMVEVEGGGTNWAGFGCGVGIIACCFGQEYLLPTTAALCGAAMDS